MSDINSAASTGTKFRVILFNGDDEVRRLNTRKRGRILPLLRNPKYTWDRIYLKVRYGESSDLMNDGWYTSVEDVQAALLAFCEPELMEYVAQFI